MFTKIPKIANFYWEGSGFSYLHYLSLKSFLHHNPDWCCNLYTNKHKVDSFIIPWETLEQKEPYRGKDYFNLVRDLPLNLIEFDFKSLDIDPGLSPVLKSDLLRWHLLSTEGGAWIDLDIIHLKPLDTLLNYIEKDCEVCYTYDGINFIIGFLMSSPNNLYYKEVYETARLQRECQYQMFGNKVQELIKNSGREAELVKDLKVHNLHMNSFYPYRWFECDQLYNQRTNKILDESVIGVHWFNGAPESRNFSSIFNKSYNLETPQNNLACILADLQRELQK